MKTKAHVVDADFRVVHDGNEQAVTPRGRRPAPRRRRGNWVAVILMIAIVWPVRALFATANFIGGSVIGELLRIVVVPAARLAAVVVAFTAAGLGVMYLGAYAVRDGVRETRTLADDWHAALNRGTDALLALVPARDPIPRAIPVPDDWSDDRPGDQPEQMVGSVGTLLPSLVDMYPRTENLPPIDGDILELAGGHRMQMLITEILPAIQQVESSGRQELIGDNGLAFGPLQVRHEPCEDLAQFFGVVVKPQDCNGNYALSEYVVRLYLGYWGVQYEMQTGRPATAEVLCRTWNGGPDQGPRNRTDIYWAKCMKHDSAIAQLAAY